MNKVIVPLIVAGVLGLGAATTVYSLISKKGAPITIVAAETKMVVAKHAIVPGQTITADDLTTVSVSGKKEPDGTFAAPADVAGRVALIPIGENQPVLASLLADPNAGSGLQALLPDGTRAITLQVDEVSGVGGLLVPGCRVDVLTSLHESGADSLMTRTLVQDVKVIAVGQSLAAPSADGGIARSVTMVVTPQQAETIELASNVGRPRLILRSGADHNIISSEGVRLSELNGTKPIAAIAVNNKINHSVEIIRGGTESTVTFPDATGIAQSQPAVTPSVAGGKSDTSTIAPR
jgi:pilus assembly protein CpaB